MFLLGVATVGSGFASPPLALALGLAFGMLLIHPFEKESRVWSKWLLQVSVVALGFGMDAREVLHAGRSGFLYTAIGIALAMAVGWVLGKVLKVKSKVSFLITAGTAICGGSAIAAIAGVTNPDDEELAMSLGTVFTLNSVALLIFPAIGWAMHLTQTQFGLWSALAIHDTSSVVGAAAKFGPQAVAVGTVVKLTRALWILPVAMLTAVISKSEARLKIPWFIFFFCLAALANTWLVGFNPLFSRLSGLGRIGLALTLFLIGSGISMRTIKQAGGRAMAQGILLWIVVASLSLFAIYARWISI